MDERVLERFSKDELKEYVRKQKVYRNRSVKNIRLLREKIEKYEKGIERLEAKIRVSEGNVERIDKVVRKCYDRLRELREVF